MSSEEKCMFYKNGHCVHRKAEGKECDGEHEPPYCPTPMAHVENHPRKKAPEEMYKKKKEQRRLTAF